MTYHYVDYWWGNPAISLIEAGSHEEALATIAARCAAPGHALQRLMEPGDEIQRRHSPTRYVRFRVESSPEGGTQLAKIPVQY